MIESYLTTKIVKAEPMTREEFDLEKGVVSNVEIIADGYKIYYPDGYISWCPKKEFERCSRKITSSEIQLII